MCRERVRKRQKGRPTEKQGVTGTEGIDSPLLLLLPFNSDVCTADVVSETLFVLEMSKKLLWLLRSCSVSSVAEKKGRECHCNCSVKTCYRFSFSLSVSYLSLQRLWDAEGENPPPPPPSPHFVRRVECCSQTQLRTQMWIHKHKHATTPKVKSS